MYYEAWKNNPDRVDFLAEIARMYAVGDVDKYKNQEERQRGLFIQVLYMNGALKKGGYTEALAFNRALLQSFYEDMFFRNLSFTRPLFESLYADMSGRGATEQTILSPDNRKSQLSIDELQSLIRQLPEISEGTKELIRIRETEKKLKEKRQK